MDTGGTFTDCLAVDPAGRRLRTKVLSSGALRLRVDKQPTPRDLELETTEDFARDFFVGWRVRLDDRSIEVASSRGGALRLAESIPEIAPGDVLLTSPEDAAVVAIRRITRTSARGRLPRLELRLATTRGTNALLERKGASVAMFVTRGFGDLLRIGNQQRPELFARQIRKSEPLHDTIVEVEERLEAGGAVLEELDEEALGAEAARLVEAGYRSAAIAFLHSYRNPEHEERAAELLRVAGFRYVSCSSVLSSRIQYVARAQAALVDAYLAEILGQYLKSIGTRTDPRSLHVMTSSGGLVRAEDFRAKDSLLSGPAAGAVGAVSAGLASGFERILAFDMGGTSTDVCRYDGELELRSVTAVGDVRLLSPSVGVETVAAGGGSICTWSEDGVRVGPESAGAHPGPACYGSAGPLTVTDVNLLLGRLVRSRFPFRLDREAAERRLGEMVSENDRGRALAGFLAIANERMAGAIRAISVRRGYDPAQYVLVAFGGAGPQHAAALAEHLGIRRVLIPRDGGVLSAAGLLEARLERWVERQILEDFDVFSTRMGSAFSEATAAASKALEREGVAADAIQTGPKALFLRYQGQESTLSVRWTQELSAKAVERLFEQAYLARYGYLPDVRTLEAESLRVVVTSGRGSGEGSGSNDVAISNTDGEPERQTFWDGKGWAAVEVLERDRMAAGSAVKGPCMIAERHSVTVVERGWMAHLDSVGGLILERQQ